MCTCITDFHTLKAKKKKKKSHSKSNLDMEHDKRQIYLDYVMKIVYWNKEEVMIQTQLLQVSI